MSHLFSVPYQPAWVHWGNFQIDTYVSLNSTFQLENYGPQLRF